MRKEDHVRPELQRMQRCKEFGVYYILRSMEVGPTFRCSKPRYPVEDPDYRIQRRQRSRYTHFYFYIHDSVLAATVAAVGMVTALMVSVGLGNSIIIASRNRAMAPA